MTFKRKAPNMSEKLAAALLQLLEFRDGQFRPVIDRAWAKDKTAAQIIARFECDHYPISVMAGGNNHPTNLQWLTKEEHKQKTHGPDRVFHNKLRKKRKRAKKPEVEAPEKKPLTEAAKQYRQTVYAQRKAKRKAWLKKLNRGGKDGD